MGELTETNGSEILKCESINPQIFIMCLFQARRALCMHCQARHNDRLGEREVSGRENSLETDGGAGSWCGEFGEWWKDWGLGVIQREREGELDLYQAQSNANH